MRQTSRSVGILPFLGKIVKIFTGRTVHLTIGEHVVLSEVDNEWRKVLKVFKKTIRVGLGILLLLVFLSSSAIPPYRTFDYRMGAVVAGYEFSFAKWEAGAITRKLDQMLTSTVGQLSAAENPAGEKKAERPRSIPKAHPFQGRGRRPPAVCCLRSPVSCHRTSHVCAPCRSKLKSTTCAPSRSSWAATMCFLSKGQ